VPLVDCPHERFDVVAMLRDVRAEDLDRRVFAEVVERHEAECT
jgi:hypothetical protein